jgi:AcrR family transcriptional regulator
VARAQHEELQPIGTSRRERILDAALQCFLAHGVGGTSVDDIRHASDASIGSIYHFFGSKEGLAAALYVATLRAYLTNYLDALASSRSARGGVESAVRAHLRWVADNELQARYLMLCREAELLDAFRPTVAELYDDFYRDATAWVEPHARAGRIRRLAPRLCQALWMGPVTEYSRLWLTRDRHHFDLHEAATPLARAAWEALEGPKS